MNLCANFVANVTPTQARCMCTRACTPENDPFGECKGEPEKQFLFALLVYILMIILGVANNLTII